LTNKAVGDLNGMWEYTLANWSQNQADKYYKLRLDSCQEIAQHPELGKKYNGIKDELFGLR